MAANDDRLGVYSIQGLYGLSDTAAPPQRQNCQQVKAGFASNTVLLLRERESTCLFDIEMSKHGPGPFPSGLP